MSLWCLGPRLLSQLSFANNGTQIICFVRGNSYKATRENVVVQLFIAWLLEKGVSKSLLSMEEPIQMGHKSSTPKRADIAIRDKNLNQIRLVVECKAEIKSGDYEQLVSYMQASTASHGVLVDEYSIQWFKRLPTNHVVPESFKSVEDIRAFLKGLLAMPHQAGGRGFGGTKKVQKGFVRIPAGEFWMGALEEDKGAYEDEVPRHKVRITTPFLMSKYPCTQALYQKVMGSDPSRFKDATRPVENVSWCDAVLFCNKLSLIDGLEPVYVLPVDFEWIVSSKRYVDDCDEEIDELSEKVKWNRNANGYRLPTEAQWEYCARGGEEHFYAGSDTLDEVGWYRQNSNSETHPVGQKKPNGFGLYDMSGNVWEWVWDSWYDYSSDSVVDPVHLDRSSPGRVGRGGSWSSNAWDGRVSFRDWFDASLRYFDQGFRFLRTLQ